MRRAALVAVGSELLRLARDDTNTAWISARLARLGVETVCRVHVCDEPAAIASVLRAAIETADLAILTGGLGPTDDDRTRQALALALDRPLEHDASKETSLRQRLMAADLPWTKRQARQAWRPADARWIENKVGSADGLWIEAAGTTVVALPGVPSEMRPMFVDHVDDWVRDVGRHAEARASIRVFGHGEATVDERLSDLYEEPGIDVTILSAPGEIEVAVRSVAESAATAETKLDAFCSAVQSRFAHDVYVDEDRSLAGLVGDLLVRRGETLATAESCTAGMIAAEVTTVPGSSAWFRGGWVLYSDELKSRLAAIDLRDLEQHGAVSERVARRLAEAAREGCSADWGLGVTGIAGPGGGSEDKPVGLVHVALASAAETWHWRTLRPGDRDYIRRRTVAFALDRLRRALTGTDT
jgi:nicotinamide-nucleotide amidase